MSIESVMPPNHLFLCCPLLLTLSILTAFESFHISQFFTTGGQSIRVSASASVQFSTVQSINCVQIFETPWTAVHQASLSITSSQSPPKPMSIELVMPYNYRILCCPLLLLPSIFPRIFSNKSALQNRWPKYWSFSFSSSPSNKYSGLIFFRMDWLDLLAVQGHRWYHPILLCLLLASSLFVDFL